MGARSAALAACALSLLLVLRNRWQHRAAGPTELPPSAALPLTWPQRAVQGRSAAQRQDGLTSTANQSATATSTANQSTTASHARCWSAALASVAASKLTFVLTWSRGSRVTVDRHRYDGLAAVAGKFARLRSVTLLVDAKGSRCEDLPHALNEWTAQGRVHCLQGPNMAAREAHTILRFVLEFYDHLPEAVIFIQDDPIEAALLHIARRPAKWVKALEASYAARAAVQTLNASTAWSPKPCACSGQSSTVNRPKYGHFRSIRWWADAFLGGKAPLEQLIWPRAAQFAVTRGAIRQRSRSFYQHNAALASMPAPLKAGNGTRRAGDLCVFTKKGSVGCAVTLRERDDKWRNFGPWVVDLGTAIDDLHGMNLALLYERLWFAIFDPARPEARPEHPECFSIGALAESPVRCGPRCFPSSGQAGGCARTDATGKTTSPPNWRFSPGRQRCLSNGCWSAEWRAAAAAGRVQGGVTTLPISEMLERVAMPGGGQSPAGAGQPWSGPTDARVWARDLSPMLGPRPECVITGSPRTGYS